MLRVIIIDDEPMGRDILVTMLNEHFDDVEILAVCENGKDGVHAILTHKPDAIFLDVVMPGMDGFDVLDCVKSLVLQVIFVTGNDQYAVRAFRYSALDFLSKPFYLESLREAIEKAKTRHYSEELQSKNDFLTGQLKGRENAADVIALSMADGLQVVQIQDVMYCKADRNYTHVFIQPQQKILVSRPLKEFETILLPHGFFRIHHSALINLRYVSKYVRSDGGYVLMKDGAMVEIARQRKDEFLNLIQKV